MLIFVKFSTFLIQLIFRFIFSLVLLVDIDKDRFRRVLDGYFIKHWIGLNGYFSVFSAHSNRMIKHIGRILYRHFLLVLANLNRDLILRDVVHLDGDFVILDLHHADTPVMVFRWGLIELNADLFFLKEVQSPKA